MSSSIQISMSKYPAVRIVLFFMLGILMGKAGHGGITIPFGGMAILIGVGIWAWRFSQAHFSVTKIRVFRVCYLCTIFFFGWIRTDLVQHTKLGLIGKLCNVSPWETVLVDGVIKEVRTNSNGLVRYDLETTSVTLESGLIIREKQRIRILTSESVAELEKEDAVIIRGKIIPINEPRNPGQFNYKQYLNNKGIVGQVKLEQLISVSKPDTVISISFLQKKVNEIIGIVFDNQTSGIAKAILIGNKSDIQEEIKTDFSRAGLSHIMAVSGLHVGFVIAPFWLVIPFLWHRRSTTIAGFIVFLSFLFLYAALAGFPASVLRASLTAVFLTASKLFYRSANAINITSASALVLLIINPHFLFEIGFQLSFSAVYTIILVLPAIQQFLPSSINHKWYSGLMMVFIVSLLVQIGLLPIQIHYFNELSMIGPFANVLFVPFLGFIVPWSFLCIGIGFVFPNVGAWLNYPSDIYLQIMMEFVNFSSSLEWAWINMNSLFTAQFPIWIVGLIAIATWKTPQLRWKLIAVFLFFISISLFIPLIDKQNKSELMVLILDVGQGDAAIVQTPNGKTILIDLGVWSPAFDSGQSIILPYLEHNHIQKIDAIFLSHPHADHIGGILSILQGIEVEVIYNSGFSYDSNLFREYQRLAEEQNTPVVSVEAGTVIPIDNSVLLLVMGPENAVFGSDPNEHSLILKLQYMDTSFLFTGDAGLEQEERLVKNYGILLDSDFLKIGHHGSNTSSSSEFIQLVSPEISTISVGEVNRYNHPNPEAISRILKSETQLFFTSRDQALMFKSNGTKVWKEDWN